MIDQAIWWGCIALEVALLVRCFAGRLLVHYPVFYAYILFVCLQSLIRFSVYHLYPQLYAPLYWITQWLCILTGCGVVFEIYRVGLRAYPGAARMARNLLALVFILVSTKVIVDTSNDSRWWMVVTNNELERALRTVQALAIVALVVLFIFYAIPFGRNLRGVLLGYGLFISQMVIWLTFFSPGSEKFPEFWFKLLPASYFVILVVWLTHLWSYAPNPQPRNAVQLEEQYQRVAAATSRRLREARGYVGKAVRP
jgi:hypothetical protein